MSDADEEAKAEDCKQMEGLGHRKRDISQGNGRSRMLGVPHTNTFELDTGVVNLTDGSNTDRTEKT